MKTFEGHNVKIFTDNVEDSALEQIGKLLSIDVFADKKIRIMPDVHAGTGCVIGFTGDLGDKVIPNIVGADIGCGMRVPDACSVALRLTNRFRWKISRLLWLESIPKPSMTSPATSRPWHTNRQPRL